ncbi:cancer/testis antigen family 47 member C1-like [Eurosta solidaginis]|uniref:cancer/testis antigen family 47 member C1-like n=1 Tax=Eurosta solidaginis TaxID=178769 RepID=UPI0035308A1C
MFQKIVYAPLLVLVLLAISESQPLRRGLGVLDDTIDVFPRLQKSAVDLGSEIAEKVATINLKDDAPAGVAENVESEVKKDAKHDVKDGAVTGTKAAEEPVAEDEAAETEGSGAGAAEVSAVESTAVKHDAESNETAEEGSVNTSKDTKSEAESTIQNAAKSEEKSLVDSVAATIDEDLKDKVDDISGVTSIESDSAEALGVEALI